MDLTVVAYLLYFTVTIPLTVWVGRALRRHGEVFLIDVFRGDNALAHAVNQLLVIGFYLVNFGYVSFFMAADTNVETGRGLLELLSTKVGGVALVVGVLHFGNVWCLNAFRRRALMRAEAVPAVTPVAPNRYRPVGAPPQPQA